MDPTFNWPTEPNFDDRIVSYVLDEEHFKPSPPTPLVEGWEKETFMGYYRDAKRGVGTRNYVVVFSGSSLCSRGSSLSSLQTAWCASRRNTVRKPTRSIRWSR